MFLSNRERGSASLSDHVRTATQSRQISNMNTSNALRQKHINCLSNYVFLRQENTLEVARAPPDREKTSAGLITFTVSSSLISVLRTKYGSIFILIPCYGETETKTHGSKIFPSDS